MKTIKNFYQDFTGNPKAKKRDVIKLLEAKLKKDSRVFVHDGIWHLDDVLSIVIINDFCKYIGIEKPVICRSRIIPDDFQGLILDETGTKNNVSVDHHQPWSQKYYRRTIVDLCADYVPVNDENFYMGIPYATAGLLWETLKSTLYKYNYNINFRIADDFFESADASDNGCNVICHNCDGEKYTKKYWDDFAVELNYLKNNYFEHRNEEKVFNLAIAVAKNKLNNLLYDEPFRFYTYIENRSKICFFAQECATQTVKEAYQKAENPQIFYLGDTFMPFFNGIDRSKCCFVLRTEGSDKCYAHVIQNYGAYNCPLPDEWLGQPKEILKQLTNKNLTFVHSSGFLMSTEGKDCLSEMVELCSNLIRQNKVS